MLGTKSLSNDLCRGQQATQPSLRRSSSMDDDVVDTPNAHVFNSMEFGRFLSKEWPSELADGTPASGLFLSKDSALPAFDSSAFQSKDFFSSMFASKEWEMKYPHEQVPSKPSREPEDSVHKTHKSFSNTTQSAEEMDVPDLRPSEVLKSGDWMPLSTLGKHVDVQYTPFMFSSSNSDAGSLKDMELPPAWLPPVKNEWDQHFMAQLMPPPSPTDRSLSIPEQATLIAAFAAPEPSDASTSAPMLAFDGQFAPIPHYPASGLIAPAAAPQAILPALEAQEDAQISDPTDRQVGQTRKRKRAPRKKIVPVTKQYVEPTDDDVLCGRGGRSNHHPGNKVYRDEVEELKPWYRELEDKDEKTLLSQTLVDSMRVKGARFLERDEHGWYVIDDVVARRKAGQALREDSDPETRNAKRRRFLEKRAREKVADEPRKQTRQRG
jgi:hypothetical protein